MSRASHSGSVGFFLVLCASSSFAQPVPLTYGTVRGSAPVLTPPAAFSLTLSGDLDLGGSIFKDGLPFLHNDGGSSAYNTALGLDALSSSTVGVPAGGNGVLLTALGAGALRNNTEGFQNTANGVRSLYYNTTGYNNSATGTVALYSNSTGSYNTAMGALAMQFNQSGNRNTALGFAAGFGNTEGSDNIWIGAQGSEESNTLRIGGGTGTSNFQQSRTFVSGIRDASGTFSQAVCVNSSNQLGPCSASSRRFKEDIADLGPASEQVFDLRPVSFRYKQELVEPGRERLVEIGFIAEEVAEIYPQLVTYNAAGDPVTVRYESLTPLLLNELKKLRAEILRLGNLEAIVREQADRLARLETVPLGSREEQVSGR